jgi:GNAT superfamily N-acetyltransferase
MRYEIDYHIVRCPNLEYEIDFDGRKVSLFGLHKTGAHLKIVSYVALAGTTVAGVLGIRVDDKAVNSHGTAVRPAYRKNGIGMALWEEMLKQEQPNMVVVNVITDMGLTLIKKVRAKYPTLAWVVIEDAGRKLRNLRKTA